MKSILLALVISCLAGTRAFAQNETEVIKDSDMEIRFTVPEGWQATKKANTYLLGSSHTQGFMLIKVQEFSSLKKLVAAMKSGIEQEDGSMMLPIDELNTLGKQGVSGMYAGTIDGTRMKGFLMALMPPSKGKAAICISVAPEEVFNQSNMDQLKLLMRSVIFD